MRTKKQKTGRKKVNFKRRPQINISEAMMGFHDKCHTPEEKLWFFVLLCALDDYTCGIFSDMIVSYNEKDHNDAGRYIFGDDNDDFNCFDELWLYFFPNIDLGCVKMALRKKYESKLTNKLEVSNAVFEGISGSRKGTGTSSNVQPEGNPGICIENSWFESVLFGSNDS